MNTTLLVTALGAALLDFLWQGLLVGIAAAVALALLRNAAPQLRYLVACVALALCVALPATTLVRGLAAPAAPVAAATPAKTTTALTVTGGLSVASERPISTATPPARATRWQQWRHALQPRLPLLVTLWSLGASLLALRMASGLAWVAGAGGARSRPHVYWQAQLDALAERMQLPRRVLLRVVDGLDSPAAARVWRPVVLLPAALIARMPADLLEALLAHELAHIRRHDYLVNLLQSLVEALLFYHPVVWWLSRRIRNEREQIADDLAAQAIGDPRRLARALAELARCNEPHPVPTPTLALAAAGGTLMSRIHRLLRPRRQTLDWKFVLPVLGLSVACVAALAQSAPTANVAPSGIVSAVATAAPATDVTVAAAVGTAAQATDVSVATGAGTAVAVQAAVDASIAVEAGAATAASAAVEADAEAGAAVNAEADAAAARARAEAERDAALSAQEAEAHATLAALDAEREAAIAARGAERDAARAAREAERESARTARDAERAARDAARGDNEASIRSNGTLRIDSRGRDGDYAVVSADPEGPNLVSASLDDIRRLDGLRSRVGGEFLWTRRDGRDYVVTDPAILGRVRTAWAPTEPLGREMEVLGDQMEKHGEVMEEIGTRMEAQADSGEPQAQAMEQLGEQMSVLGEKQAEQAALLTRASHDAAYGDEAKRADAERRVAAAERAMEDLETQMDQLGTQMEAHGDALERAHAPLEALGKEMERAAEPMEALGDQMEVLGDKMEALSEQADAATRAAIEEAAREGKLVPLDSLATR